MKSIVYLLGMLLLPVVAAAQLPAFPGAGGFGKFASGGRGGYVVAVTNLADTGVGSLRWALDQYVDTIRVFKDSANPSVPVTLYRPLTIVFRVSGTIQLKSDLRIRRDHLTIAGQTAPCDGICISGRSVLLNGATTSEFFYWGPRRKNVILRYIRFRPGIPYDANGNPTSSFVTYGLDVENYENVIIDHCTMSWANEECMAIYDNKNTTVQWCMVYEGLYNAYHLKGVRGYGGVWGGQLASYQYNLLAHQYNRSPRFNGARAHDTIALVDYRNNVNYNWATSSATYGGDVEVNGGIARLNELNNYYKPGPATPSTHKLMRPDYSANATGVGRFHVQNNIIEGNAARTADNWLAVDFANIPAASLDSSRSDTAFTIAVPLLVKTAQEAYDTVLKYAGVLYPRRDVADARIAREVSTRTTSGTGSANKPGIIDNPTAVGGWPNLQSCTGPSDTDNDGMPDEWELENGLNPNNPDDRNLYNADGYTKLEQYLNNLGNYTVSKKSCGTGDTLTFACDLSSTGFQWEENTGNGFVTMPGKTDSLLTLQLPTSAYGYSYRCKTADNRYSQLYRVKFEQTWRGTADSSWNNPLNWDCNRVPDQYTDVYIPVGGLIEVDAPASCRTLRITHPNAELRITSGNQLHIVHQ